MGRIRQLSANEVEKILKGYGFAKVSQKGSHRKWRNIDQRLQVVVPFHKGRNVPIETLYKIMNDANIPSHEWQSDEPSSLQNVNQCFNMLYIGMHSELCISGQ